MEPTESSSGEGGQFDYFDYYTKMWNDNHAQTHH